MRRGSLGTPPPRPISSVSLCPPVSVRRSAWLGWPSSTPLLGACQGGGNTTLIQFTDAPALFKTPEFTLSQLTLVLGKDPEFLGMFLGMMSKEWISRCFIFTRPLAVGG